MHSPFNDSEKAGFLSVDCLSLLGIHLVQCDITEIEPYLWTKISLTDSAYYFLKNIVIRIDVQQDRGEISYLPQANS